MTGSPRSGCRHARVLGRVPIWVDRHQLLISSCGRQQREANSLVSLVRALIMGAVPSTNPNYLPKFPLPNTITFREGFQQMSGGRAHPSLVDNHPTRKYQSQTICRSLSLTLALRTPLASCRKWEGNRMKGGRRVSDQVNAWMNDWMDEKSMSELREPDGWGNSAKMASAEFGGLVCAWEQGKGVEMGAPEEEKSLANINKGKE